MEAGYPGAEEVDSEARAGYRLGWMKGGLSWGRRGCAGSLWRLMRPGRRWAWCSCCRKEVGSLVGTSGLPGPSNGLRPPMKPREAKGPPADGGMAPMGPPGPRLRPGGGP